MHLAVVDGELHGGTHTNNGRVDIELYGVEAVWGTGTGAVGYCLWSLDSVEAAGEGALASSASSPAAADTTNLRNIPIHSSRSISNRKSRFIEILVALLMHLLGKLL
jgi:hypothetical protein